MKHAAPLPRPERGDDRLRRRHARAPYEGYKGGTYRATRHTPVWVDCWGRSTDTRIVAVTQTGWGAVVKALSLWQPYASLIAAGAKPFETRKWAPPWHLIGKRIAIHAAVRRPTRLGAAALFNLGVADALGRADWLDGLPYGAVVCTAVLRGAYRTASWAHHAGAPVAVDAVAGPTPPRATIPTDPWGDYSPGRWCWHLVDIRPVDPPVPLKGRHGLFAIADDLIPEDAR